MYVEINTLAQFVSSFEYLLVHVSRYFAYHMNSVRSRVAIPDDTANATLHHEEATSEPEALMSILH
jgi:hypothetical protein